jgi:hypothetical protein
VRRKAVSKHPRANMASCTSSPLSFTPPAPVTSLVFIAVLIGCGSSSNQTAQSSDTAPTAAGGGSVGAAAGGGTSAASGGRTTVTGGAGDGTGPGGAAGLGGSNTGTGGNTLGNGGNSVGAGGIMASTSGGTTGSGGSAADGTLAGIGGAPTGTGGSNGTTGGGGHAPGLGGIDGQGGSGSTPGGAAATGGVTGDDRVCGTAAEGDSVTLRCPEGQVIDSVVFASYGTPSGDCGSFASGDCHAASSETTVSSLCVGRAACTVAAINGSFGDPCRSVVKDLAVEVSCVVGEPIVETGAPYKGVANSPAGEIAALGATWCYNWSTSPQATDCDDPYFVPMIWGPGDVAGAIRAIGDAGYTTVLGFNEPNKSDQANMSVQEAIALWPAMTSDPNIRVGSPAVSDDGRAWLEDFMDQVQARGLRVDFIAMHWYGWNAGSCVAGQLEGAVNWASQWSLPIWITEWGCMGSSNADEQTVLNFFNNAITMLQDHPLVERYAWYPWNTYNHLYLPDESGVRIVTALGEAFAAAPPYR